MGVERGKKRRLVSSSRGSHASCTCQLTAGAGGTSSWSSWVHHWDAFSRPGSVQVHAAASESWSGWPSGSWCTCSQVPHQAYEKDWGGHRQPPAHCSAVQLLGGHDMSSVWSRGSPATIWLWCKHAMIVKLLLLSTGFPWIIIGMLSKKLY